MSLRNRLGLILLNVNEAIRELEREEVMPTDRPNKRETQKLDTLPPSAHSQAGAFVPTERMREEMTRRINHEDLNAPFSRLARADAAFAYAQECGAITTSPAEPPATTVERIKAIIRKWNAAEYSKMTQEQADDACAREIAALFPARAPEPLLEQCEHSEVDLQEMEIALLASSSQIAPHRAKRILDEGRDSCDPNDKVMVVRARRRAIAAFATADRLRPALPPKVAELVREAKEFLGVIHPGAKELFEHHNKVASLALVRRLAALGEKPNE